MALFHVFLFKVFAFKRKTNNHKQIVQINIHAGDDGRQDTRPAITALLRQVVYYYTINTHPFP